MNNFYPRKQVVDKEEGIETEKKASVKEEQEFPYSYAKKNFSGRI